MYPHKDVKRVEGARAVQQGVWYCPEPRFIAFDVMVTMGDDSAFFLPFYDLVTVLRACRVPVVKQYYRGMREDVIAWAVEHAADPVDVDAHLPVIENNRGEGWVVRPVVEAVDRYGDRVILKIKNPAFQEVQCTAKVRRHWQRLLHVSV